MGNMITHIYLSVCLSFYPSIYLSMLFGVILHFTGLAGLEKPTTEEYIYILDFTP